jgi:peptidylprolyl isomerase
MTQVQLGDTVQVHYTGKLADGTIFDSSQQHEPLQLTLGQSDVIPGFEQAILGMNLGDSKTETIPSDQAYGAHQTEWVIQVDRQQLPPDLQPQIGQRLQMRQPNGTAIGLTVTGVTESHVTVDANHPLAGQDLTFDITLVAIL